MIRPQFISFEGGDGSGKSTQIKNLAAKLQTLGEVLITREPGGTPRAEQLRDLLVRKADDMEDWLPLSELLLMYTSRLEHTERKIKPALEKGAWVLCDRYADSSFAYQGGGHGIPASKIEALHTLLLDNFQPGLTFFLALPAEAGLARSQGALKGEDRMEGLGVGFHARVQAEFHKRAAAEPDRFRVIDAGQKPEDIADQVWQAVRDTYKLPR